MLACGDDDSSDGRADAATVDSGSSDATSRPDSSLDSSVDATSTEPCDFQNPTRVVVGETITTASPSCPDGLHFYEFVPDETGVYEITKTGEGNLIFCETQEGGCICGPRNCCPDCTLTFALLDGSPLPAGSMNEISVGGSGGTYSFTITGPQ